MILVTTGISGAPFDRLLRVIDEIETEESIVVQHGPSQVRPNRARCVPYLPFEELTKLVSKAETVITHAGAGSVLVALVHGRRPIVVPRRPEFGELVDEHQLLFARHLAKSDLVILVEEPEELPSIVAARPATRLHRNGHHAALVDDLSDYLRSLRARS